MRARSYLAKPFLGKDRRLAKDRVCQKLLTQLIVRLSEGLLANMRRKGLRSQLEWQLFHTPRRCSLLKRRVPTSLVCV